MTWVPLIGRCPAATGQHNPGGTAADQVPGDGQADVAKAAGDQVGAAGITRGRGGPRQRRVAGHVPPVSAVGRQQLRRRPAQFGGQHVGRGRDRINRVEVDVAGSDVDVLLVGDDRQDGDRGLGGPDLLIGCDGVPSPGHDHGPGGAGHVGAERGEQPGYRHHGPLGVIGSGRVQRGQVDDGDRAGTQLLGAEFLAQYHLGPVVAQPLGKRAGDALGVGDQQVAAGGRCGGVGARGRGPLLGEQLHVLVDAGRDGGQPGCRLGGCGHGRDRWLDPVALALERVARQPGQPAVAAPQRVPVQGDAEFPEPAAGLQQGCALVRRDARQRPEHERLPACGVPALQVRRLAAGAQHDAGVGAAGAAELRSAGSLGRRAEAIQPVLRARCLISRQQPG